MTRLLFFLLISSVTLFAQRTPLSVNGTIVDNPNFITGPTALIGRSGANISVAPTNIANAQIVAGAAIDVSKLSGVAPTVHAHAGEDITSGTVAEPRIASAITRDSELTAGLAAKANLDSPAFTDDVGIGVAPVAGTALTIKGTTSDSTAYQISGLDNSDRQILRIDNDGRIDLTRYASDGAIMVLGGRPASASNGDRVGHYAFQGLDNNGQGNTIATVEARIGNVASNNLASSLRFYYMDAVNDSPGGVYAYQQPNVYMSLSSAGLNVPQSNISVGTNTLIATAGAIRLKNNDIINMRNAANNGNVTVANVGTSDDMYIGANSSLVALQVGASTRWFVNASGHFIPGANNTYDIGSSSTQARNINLAGRLNVSALTKGDSTSATYTESYNLSGAADPQIVAANNSISFNVPVTMPNSIVTVTTADTTALTVSGGSTTGSGTTKGGTFSHTLNTSGVVDGVWTVGGIDTASGANSLWFKVVGGAAGTTSLFSVDKDGDIVAAGTSFSLVAGNIDIAQGGFYRMSGRGGLSATANGSYFFANQAQSGFTSLTLGPDDASPNNATLDGASGVGTDIAGGNLTIAGGQSTGTGRGGALIGQTSPSSTTGSSANAYSERYHHAAKAVTLTSATATTVATIACPAAKFVGGECVVTVFATDATDYQARTLRFSFSAINKAATVTAGIDTPDESIAASTGTLTAAITAVANGNAVDIKVNADSSLTETTLSATVSFPSINSNDTAAVTEI